MYGQQLYMYPPTWDPTRQQYVYADATMPRGAAAQPPDAMVIGFWILAFVVLVLALLVGLLIGGVLGPGGPQGKQGIPGQGTQGGQGTPGTNGTNGTAQTLRRRWACTRAA